MSKKILYVCAMKEEFEGFKIALKNQNIKFSNNKNDLSFKIKNNKCLVSIIGITFFNIGKLTKLLHSFKPDCVISFGTQAGLKKQKIGEVVVSNNVKCSDLDLTNFGYKDGTIDKVNTSKVVGPLMCSGSHFMENKSDKIKLKKRFKNVSTFDMETYMLYCVCREYNIPYISMKAISDNGEEKPNKSFEKNILDVSTKSSEFAIKNYNYLFK